jgi:hypothetical protein
MGQKDELSDLFDSFKSCLEKAKPEKRAKITPKVLRSLHVWTRALAPTQKEIKQELLTNETAIEIREIYHSDKKLFDLLPLAQDLAIFAKRPTIDHILAGYYYPENRLRQLKEKFESIVDSDPAMQRKRMFLEWRGRLRSLTSEEEIAKEINRLIASEGLKTVREFAAHLKTRDLNGKRKLPRNSALSRMVKAVSTHLWREKMTSKALEGHL